MLTFRKDLKRARIERQDPDFTFPDDDLPLNIRPDVRRLWDELKTSTIMPLRFVRRAGS